jgi:hypothetical protein
MADVPARGIKAGVQLPWRHHRLIRSQVLPTLGGDMGFPKKRRGRRKLGSKKRRQAWKRRHKKSRR